MERGFSETMSALRQERGLSQRSAAAELKISQALLSHYENGAREPGLGFVCRACRYYGVSADYLLGLSDSRGDCRKREELSGMLAQLRQLTQKIENALEELDR